MINLAILTSNNNDLNLKVIQHFENFSDVRVKSIISNTEEKFINLRRYKINEYNTPYYKDIDRILTDDKIHFIVLVEYNEKLPKNFTKKYKWKTLDYKKQMLTNQKEGISIIYNSNELNKDEIIFEKELTNLVDVNIGVELNDLIERFYPTIIERVIVETYNKIYDTEK